MSLVHRREEILHPARLKRVPRGVGSPTRSYRCVGWDLGVQGAAPCGLSGTQQEGDVGPFLATAARRGTGSDRPPSGTRGPRRTPARTCGPSCSAWPSPCSCGGGARSFRSRAAPPPRTPSPRTGHAAGRREIEAAGLAKVRTVPDNSPRELRPVRRCSRPRGPSPNCSLHANPVVHRREPVAPGNASVTSSPATSGRSASFACQFALASVASEAGISAPEFTTGASISRARTGRLAREMLARNECVVVSGRAANCLRRSPQRCRGGSPAEQERSRTGAPRPSGTVWSRRRPRRHAGASERCDPTRPKSGRLRATNRARTCVRAKRPRSFELLRIGHGRSIGHSRHYNATEHVSKRMGYYGIECGRIAVR